MPKNILATVNEKSSIGITFCFADLAGEAVTPEAMTWTLSDPDGTTINAQEDIAVPAESLAASITIWLSGDDLAILDSTKSYETRVLTVQGTYSAGEESLNFVDTAKFSVRNLKAVE